MDETAKQLWKEFRELKAESQAKYLEYREANDPPYSKLNTEIEMVFATKRKQKIAKMYEYFYENDLVDKKLAVIEKKMKNTVVRQAKSLYYWITINPEEKIELKKLLKAVERLVNRAFIEEYMYVVEQRGAIEEEIGKGKHIHLYFKISEEKYQPPSKIIDRMKNTLKDVVNVETKALWIQILKPEYVKDKVNYMIDKNIDGQHEDKEEKQQMDKIFRENNNLLNYYTNINPETLLTIISEEEKRETLAQEPSEGNEA